MKKAVIRFICLMVIVGFFGQFTFANQEFENYFYKDLVKEGDSKAAEALLEKAMGAVLEGLQIPFVLDGKIEKKGFFKHIEQKIKEKDPDAKVYIAGGVVRSLLGYLYKRVYRAKEKDPTLQTQAILEKIISRKTKTNDEKVFSGLSALGIGSDLDILIIPSKVGKEKLTALVDEATAFINSAEKAMGLREEKSKLKYSIVPIGDVKEYDKQITRTLSQGGSTLDWLAFPVTGGAMKTPDEYPDIFKKFISGTYDYLPPQDKSAIEDGDKQTIRGLRSLLEIPFLDLSPAGEAQMKTELHSLINKVKKGGSLSAKAYEQFDKMVRNARFEAAHNRFYRGKTQSGDNIDSLVLQLSALAKKSDKKLPPVPEFLFSKDPTLRKGKDACGLQAHHQLMKKDDFFTKYTDEGVLYHGTKEVENILSIIRNGFIMSNASQGTAAYGRGAYATPHRKTAESYGVMLALKVKDTDSIRALDWKAVEKTDSMRTLQDQADQSGMSLLDYLATNCDVDFIVHEHVLIQNTGAVSLPKKIGDLVSVLGEGILKMMRGTDYFLRSDLERRFKSFKNLERLSSLLGQKVIVSSRELVEMGVRDRRAADVFTAEIATHLDEYESLALDIFRKSMEYPSAVQKLAVRLSALPQVPEELLLAGLRNREASKTMASFVAEHQERYSDLIEEMLKDSNRFYPGEGVQTLAYGLTHSQGKGLREDWIKLGLRNPVATEQFSTFIAENFSQYQDLVKEVLDPAHSYSEKTLSNLIYTIQPLELSDELIQLGFLNPNGSLAMIARLVDKRSSEVVSLAKKVIENPDLYPRHLIVNLGYFMGPIQSEISRETYLGGLLHSRLASIVVPALITDLHRDSDLILKILKNEQNQYPAEVVARVAREISDLSGSAPLPEPILNAGLKNKDAAYGMALILVRNKKYTSLVREILLDSKEKYPFPLKSQLGERPEINMNLETIAWYADRSNQIEDRVMVSLMGGLNFLFIEDLEMDSVIRNLVPGALDLFQKLVRHTDQRIRLAAARALFVQSVLGSAVASRMIESEVLENNPQVLKFKTLVETARSSEPEAFAKLGKDWLASKDPLDGQALIMLLVDSGSRFSSKALGLVPAKTAELFEKAVLLSGEDDSVLRLLVRTGMIRYVSNGGIFATQVMEQLLKSEARAFVARSVQDHHLINGRDDLLSHLVSKVLSEK